MGTEITLRKDAIRRWQNGESKTRIAKALGKSRYWVDYWIDRYNPDDPEESLANCSRAPKEPHREWSQEVIQQALTSRRLRMDKEKPGYEYALIGAEAIHYELRALGCVPTPPPRTVHYWLKQAGLVPEPSSEKEREDKSTKLYPYPDQNIVNDLHQVDLKGPLYLTGLSQKHYLLALRDYRSKGVFLTATRNRRSQTIANFLVSAWQQRGLPKVLQMDNALEFRGSNRYPRSFGKVVRLCLDVGVEPLFIPQHEPWRNGFIENFNGLADRLCLSREEFAKYVALRQGVKRLEEVINTSHRLAAIDGKTPNEFIADKSLRFLSKDYTKHENDLPLEKGKISFIRLIRKSGRITLCAEDKFMIDPELKWEYVFAQVVVQSQQLKIYFKEQLVKTFDYEM